MSRQGVQDVSYATPSGSVCYSCFRGAPGYGLGLASWDVYWKSIGLCIRHAVRTSSVFFRPAVCCC